MSISTLCILNDINYGSLPDWLSVLATLLTLVIAWKALSTWKHEKQFDISIQLLSKSREAIGIIYTLRFAAEFDGEIDPAIMAKHEKSYSNKNEHTNSYIVFQTRAARVKDSLSEIVKLKELAWAGFGEEHVFYRFYEKIMTTYYELAAGHLELLQLHDNKTELSHQEFMAENIRLRKFLYYLHDDELSKDLDALENELVKHRQIAPYRR